MKSLCLLLLLSNRLEYAASFESIHLDSSNRSSSTSIKYNPSRDKASSIFDHFQKGICKQKVPSIELSYSSDFTRTRSRRTFLGTATTTNNEDQEELPLSSLSLDQQKLWSYSDFEWRLRPPPETSKWKKLLLYLGTRVVRMECRLLRRPIPYLLCPKGDSAVLETYHKKKKIARFGITTNRGPPASVIDETVQDVYQITSLPPEGPAIAAIIFMFVEPKYRGSNVGTLALDVIGAIHTIEQCDFTVLVADDNGSGKLIKFYEQNGFQKAPKLQDFFGSPNGEYGITMIRPTQVLPDFFTKCQIRWW